MKQLCQSPRNPTRSPGTWTKQMQRKLFNCWDSAMLRYSRRRGKSCPPTRCDLESSLGHCYQRCQACHISASPLLTLKILSPVLHPHPPSFISFFFPPNSNFFHSFVYFVRGKALFHGEMCESQRTTFGSQSVLSLRGSQGLNSDHQAWPQSLPTLSPLTAFLPPLSSFSSH